MTLDSKSALDRMEPIEGWFSREEGDLLFRSVEQVIRSVQSGAVVEIGSYCGRSTVVLGSVVQALRPSGKVYAIDPHEGVLSGESGTVSMPSSLPSFLKNIEAAGLKDVVSLIRKKSFEVSWTEPIAFLLIDGLHDYENVSRDYAHFERYLVSGALVAFHDYADIWPGVRKCVDSLLETGVLEKLAQERFLLVTRKRL